MLVFPKIAKVHCSLRSWYSHLKVKHKLTLGYALTLGTACVGVGLGLLIGNAYQHRAELAREDVLEEIQFLTDLETSLIHSQLHQEHIVDVLDYPKVALEEKFLYQKHIIELERIWSDLKTSYVEQVENETDEELALFQEIVANYDSAIALYVQQSKLFIDKIDNLSELSPEEIRKIENFWDVSQTRSLQLKLSSLSKKIGELTDIVAEEEEDAKAFLDTATGVRGKIIGFSMVLSIAMATVLASLTNRALAYPIQHLTMVAKKTTDESNFDLQVMIFAEDEVGVLAKSFNQLNQKVKHLLTTSQKQATELQQTLKKLQASQAQIIHAEKMSSLGQMVAGVAHEINNPINFIHGNITHASEYSEDLLKLITLYQHHFPQPPEEVIQAIEDLDWDFISQDLPKVLNSMQIGSERIREIVESLRNFSRLDHAEIKAVDIHEGINSSLMILHHRLKATSERKEVKLTKKYDNLPLVECYPGQLNQVFMNLLTNAIDAVENSPHPQISISTQLQHNYVEIRVADNGTGVSKETQAKLFDPFFTTKPVGKGTGLGLSISYQIITERHGGKIRCKSKLGKGTEFLVKIPLKLHQWRAA